MKNESYSRLDIGYYSIMYWASYIRYSVKNGSERLYENFEIVILVENQKENTAASKNLRNGLIFSVSVSTNLTKKLGRR